MIRDNWYNGITCALLICYSYAAEQLCPPIHRWEIVVGTMMGIGISTVIAMGLSKNPEDRKFKWLGGPLAIIAPMILMVSIGFLIFGAVAAFKPRVERSIGASIFVVLGLPYWTFALLWIFTSWSIGAIITTAWVIWLLQSLVARDPMRSQGLTGSQARA